MLATHADPDELARIAAIDFARRLVQHWQQALGADLLGAYLIGSLAHAGFSRRYSDVDIALVTTAGLSPHAKRCCRILGRLGTKGLSILGRPVLLSRPLSTTGSH